MTSLIKQQLICDDNQSGLTTYPCQTQSGLDAPIVLIHGWGADSQVWGSLPEMLTEYSDIMTLDLPGFGLSPPLAEYSETVLLDWLARVLPERCYLVGLSLGGMLATTFAAIYPARVAGLVTVSSNLSFVQREGWDRAMPQSVFEQFFQSWHDDAESCLKRFMGLQSQGDVQERQLIRQLRGFQSGYETSAWGGILSLLATLDNREPVTRLQCPVLAILGDKDTLVPASVARDIEQLNDQISLKVVAKASHLPHLSCPQELGSILGGFFDDCRYHLDKAKVAESFGRAAKRYDSAAKLQHRIGEQLIQLIPEKEIQSGILDLGCGTGYHSCQLKARFPEARVLGVDISPGMLGYAATRFPEGEWLCSDAEDLTLPDASQNIVFSNFALQWCTNLDRVSGEIYRVLALGGELYFAVPGPRTLTELRSAWSTVDDHVHVNRFFSVDDWTESLLRAGFEGVDVSHEQHVEAHESVRELLLELKAVGAHNINGGKQAAMTGKERLQKLYRAYEVFRLPNGSFPASWEIIVGRARKPMAGKGE